METFNGSEAVRLSKTSNQSQCFSLLNSGKLKTAEQSLEGFESKSCGPKNGSPIFSVNCLSP